MAQDQDPEVLSFDDFETSTQDDVISFDQIEAEETMFDAAQNADFVAQRYNQYVAELKDDPMMNRAWSAANSFMSGLTGIVPAALKTKAVFQAQVYNWFNSNDIRPEQLPDYNAGNAVGKMLEEAFPESELYRNEFWAGTIAKGGGQLTGQVLVSLAGGAAGATRGGILALNTGYQALFGSQYYEEAKAEGATDDEAYANMLVNMAGVSALEAIPMVTLMRRLDDASGGYIKRVAAAGFKGSIEEGLTEGLQQMYSNVAAQEIYDSTRGIMDGVLESAAAGAILGGAVNITLNALISEKTRTNDPEKLAQIEESIDYLFNEHADQLGDITRNDVDAFLPAEPAKSEPKVIEGETVPATEHVGDRGLATADRTDTVTGRTAWKRFADRYFHWYPVKEEAGLVLEHGRAWIRAENERSRVNATRLNSVVLEHVESDAKTISEAFTKGEIDPELKTKINEGLQDLNKIGELPPKIAEVVFDMRQHIDYLTLEIQKRGMAQGGLEVTLMENLGTYIHRSYKAFDKRVEWKLEDVPEADWNAAITAIRNQIISQRRVEGKDMLPESEMKRQAEGMLRELFYGDGVTNVAQLFRQNQEAFARDKGDLDVLLERHDIHPAIRKVLGEFDEGIFNYVNTIDKMSQSIGRRTMYDKLARNFRGELFLTREQRNARTDFDDWNYRFVTGVKSELDDLYMHKDVFDALTYNGRWENMPGWFQKVLGLNAAAKYSKTVASHVTMVRNVTGGTMFMAFNGLFNMVTQPKSGWNAAKNAFFGLKKLDKKGLSEQRIKYQRLGLIGRSTKFGEIADVAYDAGWEVSDPSQGMMYLFENMTAGNKVQKAKRGFGKVTNLLADVYKRGDDFVRIWFYELEKARYEKAESNFSEQEIADRVNKAYQNYDRVGRAAKSARVVPVVAPFISFPAEVIRTAFGSAELIRSDWASDNPKVRAVGNQRMVGMITTISGVTALGAVSQALLGISEEEDSAYREFMPPWDKGSVVAYTKARRGEVKYINTSYTNPYAYLVDPVFAFIKGADDRTVMESFLDGVKVLMEPVIGEEIFAKAAREVIFNQTSEGGEVYNPQDDMGTKMQKTFFHLWRAFEPGSLTSAKRLIEPMYDGDSKKKPEEELLGLFGLRMITIDVEESFGFSVREQRQQIRDARRVYNSVKFNENSSRQQIEAAFGVSNAQYEQLFNRLRIISESATKAGVRWGMQEQIMKDSGLSQRDIDAIRTGRFIPFER